MLVTARAVGDSNTDPIPVTNKIDDKYLLPLLALANINTKNVKPATAKIDSQTPEYPVLGNAPYLNF